MDYSPFVADSLATIQEFGFALNIISPTQVSDANFNPVTGKPTANPSPTTVASVAVQVGATKQFVDLVGRENIRQDDRVLLLPGSAPITTQVFLEFEARRWRVVFLDTLAPDGTAILHTVQARPA